MADDGCDREVEHHGADEGGDPQPWLHIGIVRTPVVGTRANNSHGNLLFLTANAAWRPRFPGFVAGGPILANRPAALRSCRPLRDYRLCRRMLGRDPWLAPLTMDSTSETARVADQSHQKPWPQTA